MHDSHKVEMLNAAFGHVSEIESSDQVHLRPVLSQQSRREIDTECDDNCVEKERQKAMN